MTEKTSGKKDHQKNKKQKQNENKKNHSNHVKHEHEVSNKSKQQKKKPNKNHVNNHTSKSNKNSNKKKSGVSVKMTRLSAYNIPSKLVRSSISIPLIPFERKKLMRSLMYKLNKVGEADSPCSFVSFLESLLLTLCFSFLILGFLYIVDYEKFSKIRDGAGFLFNKVVSLLPPSVVSKGRETYELIRPTAEMTVNKLSGFMNQTSMFLNTNPFVKDHWANVREIGSICSARMVDYMRTLYLQVTGYCNAFKSKLF